MAEKLEEELDQLFANQIANQPHDTARYQGSQGDIVSGKLAN
jgi:hypothetical protein